MFYFLKEAELLKYGDDISLSYSHPSFATLIEVLEDWVRENSEIIRC